MNRTEYQKQYSKDNRTRLTDYNREYKKLKRAGLYTKGVLNSPSSYQFTKKQSPNKCIACGGLLSLENKTEIKAGFHIGVYDCILAVKGIKKGNLNLA